MKMMSDEEKKLVKHLCESLIKNLKGRLEILEKYNEMDIHKEIIDTMNDIKRYSHILDDLNEEN